MKACLSHEKFHNSDETGLSLKMLPLDTPASCKDKSAPSYKRGRRLMTILACCMASGNHKLIAFVKSSKTETFGNWVSTEFISPYSTKIRANFLIDNALSPSNNMKMNIEKV